MLTRTRMTDWLLGMLVACTLSATLLVVSPAGAQEPAVQAEPIAGPTLAETEEASAEASEAAAEAADEAAEVAAAQVEDAAFSHVSSLSSNAEEEFPSMYKRIVNLRVKIARLRAEKQILRELPMRSKRRKAFLARKHERIMEESKRLNRAYKEIHEKKHERKLTARA